MSSPLRVVFMGTPEFAVPSLRAIIDAGHDVVAVYTRAPKPKGRGQAVQKSPIHDLADAHHIPVYTPLSFRKDLAAVDQFIALNPDVAVVAAYGLILPSAVLDAPRYGCLNVHASLLPRWRGASPIHRAIWAGDACTGVTIMQMDQGLDTGTMIVADRAVIMETTTTPEMTDDLAKMGARLMVGVLEDLAKNGAVSAMPQLDDDATLAPLLTKDDARINWHQSATAIHAQMRALTPWPGTTTILRDQDFKILMAMIGTDTRASQPGTVMNRDGDVACGHGTTLRVTQIQVPSGKKMDVAAAINGGYVQVGDIFK